MTTLPTRSIDHLLEGNGFSAPYSEPLSLECAFTEAFQRNADRPLALRELEGMRVMFPAILRPIQEADLVAGRIRYPIVGLSPEAMGLGYFCVQPALKQVLESPRFDAQAKERARKLLDFWPGRTTVERTRAAYPPEMAAALPKDSHFTDRAVAYPLYRMAGTTLDYAKLLRLGIPGLKAELRERQAGANEETRALFEAMAGALDLLASSLRTYAGQARALAATASEQREAELLAMAEALEAVAENPPATLHEAIQLFWLYALHSGTWNYGRLDVVLGPFLTRDLASGRIDEDHALKLVRSLWRLIADYDNMFNNRVYIGGKGRPDETSADRFAMIAMEATRLESLNQPQLSLRFYQGMNPDLYRKALEVIGAGCTFPMLYNDDVYIPAVMKSFGVCEAEATAYTPYGCGECVLSPMSMDTPSGLINLVKALAITLRNGRDEVTGELVGLETGPLESFRTFEDLWRAYTKQVEYFVEFLAAQQKLEYEVTSRDLPYLLISLLSDDCLERGRPAFDGGIRYLGGTLEAYGNTNAADSLTAIKTLVFDKKALGLRELVAACDANFKGHEQIRRLLLSAPKYGNDHPEADSMAVRVHEHLCHFTAAQAAPNGLHHYLIVIINNSANVDLGFHTGASPDGREAEDTLANANNPFPGMDRQGTTAFLSSLLKLDPTIHAGAVQNMKFSRDLFNRRRPKLEALLNGYFGQGGAQAMITVVSPEDLESAMKEPEKWVHLMIRMGGYSARFVDLERPYQMEVLRRTLND